MKTNFLTGALLLLSAALPAQKLALTETHRLRFDRGITKSLAFSPNERFLACGGRRGDLVVYEIATRKKVMDLDTAWGPIHRCLFFPTGKKIAVLTAELTVYSFPEGKLLERAKADGASLEDPRLAISPDGSWIAYRNGLNLLIREVDSWKIVAQATIRTDRLGWLAFGPRSAKLLIGGTAIWHWKSANSQVELLNTGRKKGNRVILAIWHGSHSELLVATDGNELQLSGLRRKLPAKAWSLTSSRDGSRIAVRIERQRILLLDEKLQPCEPPPPKRLAAASVSAWAPSGHILAFTNRQWLARQGHELPLGLWFSAEHRPGREVPDEKNTEIAGRGGAQEWFVPLEGNIGNLARASSIALDPRGRFLAVCAEGRVTTLDLNSGRSRDLGPGMSVGRGWKAGEILLNRGRNPSTVMRVQADLGEQRLLLNMDAESGLDLASILRTSPTHHRILFISKGGWNHWSRLWADTDGLQDWVRISNPEDASWSRDGTQLLIVGSLTSCIGPTRAEVQVVGNPGTAPWTQSASHASRTLPRALTGDFSPSTSQIAWGGRGGILIYTAKPSQGKQVRSTWTPTVIWLRYLDGGHILTHDGQRVSIWRTHDLKRLARFDPFQVPKDALRADKKATRMSTIKSMVNEFGVDQTPIFIHEATLSRDGKRLVLIGNKDVRVFGLKYH